MRWPWAHVIAVVLTSGLPFGLEVELEEEFPPEVPRDGAKVLLPIEDELASCKKPDTTAPPNASRRRRRRTVSDLQEFASKRQKFVCSAQCGAREPQLEISMSQFAMWDRNTSGLDMLNLMTGFCNAKRECNDGFVMAVLWRGDVHLNHCNSEGLTDSGLYLIGPEDLSINIVLLLAAARATSLDPHKPVVLGLYLSDYTCLLDRHLYGPGMPIFSYVTRETSWAMPWPSSFTLMSSLDVDKAEAKDKYIPWKDREEKAYWIGAITGPWMFQADPDLLAVPRMKLLKMASENSDTIRAEWSNTATYGIKWVKGEDTVAGFLAEEGGARDIKNLTGIAKSGFKEVQSWAGYKYYVNLDGVVMGGRLSRLMSVGGVLLQHKAGYTEHLDGLLKPYENYVPIEYDLSDLVSKVKWLQRNDKRAQKIAAAGQKLARTRMRFEDHLCYIWRALEGLQKTTAWAPVDNKEMASRLEELGFQRVKVHDGDMHKTMEQFWQKGALEDIRLGSRKMNPQGVELLKWAWQKASALSERTKPDADGELDAAQSKTKHHSHDAGAKR